MWFSSWLRNPTVSPKHSPSNRFRPALEALEDRWAPATLVVNTTLDVLGHDGGMLSLRQAILDANATPKTADIIVLPAGNYTLTRTGAAEDAGLTGDLDIKGPLTISGAGAGSTVIDGAGQDRVFQASSAAVALSGMTIQGGNAALVGNGQDNGRGGAIYNYLGSLTVANSVLSANSAARSDGGGIWSIGPLTVNSSTLSANSSAYNGGGIYSSAPLSVNNSVLSGNSALWSGGGIYHTGPTLTVNNSMLSGNSAGLWGGGTYTLGTATISTCTFSGNSARVGGGSYASATLTLSGSTFSGNTATSSGGGMYNGGTLTVSSSTFSGNTATVHGGGISNGGKLTLRGSTVLDNSAPIGADLYNFGTLSLFDSVIGVTVP